MLNNEENKNKSLLSENLEFKKLNNEKNIDKDEFLKKDFDSERKNLQNEYKDNVK